jgi:hypothetical protein
MKKNAALTSTMLVFKCTDPRVTMKVLSAIVQEANQALDCFELCVCELNTHGALVWFRLKMYYSDEVDMLNQFARLMLQIAQGGYALCLESTERRMAEMRKEVVSGFRDDNGSVVRVVVTGGVIHNPIIGDGNIISTVTTNSVTTTKIKRKHWNL